MPEQTTLSALGLHTSENELGAVPPGGLVKAENCVMLAPGLVGSRRGQSGIPHEPNGTTLNAVGLYAGETIWQTDAAKLERYTGSAFVQYPGSYTPADASLLRMKFLEAQDNLYFTTTEGVKRLGALDGVPVNAGGPKTWGLRLQTMLDAADGFLAAGESVAYRVVFGVKDENGTIHLGAPSNRLVVTNDGTAGVAAKGTLTLVNASGTVGGVINGTSVTVAWGTSDNATAVALANAINVNGTLSGSFTAEADNNVVTITCNTAGAAGNATTLVPSGVGVNASGATFVDGADSGSAQNVTVDIVLAGAWTTETFWQLYRTVSFPSDVQPGDEMYLVREGYFTLNSVGETGLSVVDTTPSSFVAAQTPLYTNSARGEGILQSNDPPPYCKDIAWWDNRMWFANVRQPERVVLTILGVGVGTNGETGIRIGDVLTIGSDSVTAADTESIVDGTFKVYTDSSLVSANISRTAESLCYIINQRTGYRASSLASVDVGSDGRILIEAEDLTTPAFNVTVRPSKMTLTALAAVDGGVGQGTTATAHNLQVGDTFSLESAAPDANFPVGVKTVTRVPTITTFWYEDVAIPFGATATGTYTETRLTPPAQSAWRPAPPVSVFDIAAGGLVRSGSTVTATTDAAHGLSIGMQIPIVAVDIEDPNFPAGTKTIVSVPSATTFTYSEAGAAGMSTVAYRSGSRVTSDPSEMPAGLARSKLQEPEAVPAVVNTEQIGVLDKQILRIVPLRQNLFVIKEEGIYIVSGGGGEYRFDPLDLAVHVYSPDSVAVVRDRIFALSNQGVVAITPNGVQVVSRDIEQELLQYFGPTLPDVRVDTFGVGHETERLYTLWLPALYGATEAPYNHPRAYVYSLIADAWTTWELERTCGLVRVSDDAFFMGTDGSGAWLENNSKTSLDYADGSATYAVTAWDESTNRLSISDTTDVHAGDVVVQGASGAAAVVISVDSATDLTLSSGGFTGSGTVAVYFAIPVDLEWRTFVGNSPADVKKYQAMHLHFRKRDFLSGSLVLASDIVPAEETITVSNASYSIDPSEPMYPGMPTRPKKTWVGEPREHAQAAYLSVAWRIREALSVWWLNGLTLVYETIGPKGQR